MFTTFLPIVASGGRVVKAGLAPSSHHRLEERVAALGRRNVAGIRGWKLGEAIPERVAGVPYLPNFWCDVSAEVRDGTAVVRSQLHVADLLAGRSELLFLNEPDLAMYGRYGQCDISPHRAAVLYRWLRHRWPELRLIGPCVSHVDYQHGWRWVGAWITEVQRVMGGALPEMWAWDCHNYLMYEPPLAIVDSLQAFLIGRGIEAGRFCLSEWGADTAVRVAEMRRAFDGDDRIWRHYFYDQTFAFWDGAGRSLMLFEEDEEAAELSVLGRAWLEAGAG